MPDLSRGTAIITPAEGYATPDYEQAKFIVTGGSVVSVRTRLASDGGTIVGTANPLPVTVISGAASGYAEGTTIGTITAPALVFRETGGTLNAVGTGHPLPTTLQTLIAGEDLTNNVLGELMKPIAAAAYAPSIHTNFGAAAGTGVAIKASAGNVYSAYVTSGTNVQRYFQIFNSATALAVGGTPIASYPIGLGSILAGDFAVLQLDTTHFAPSLYCSTGIAAAISSTLGTLGTAGITAGDYSWNIKYV